HLYGGSDGHPARRSLHYQSGRGTSLTLPSWAVRCVWSPRPAPRRPPPPGSPGRTAVPEVRQQRASPPRILASTTRYVAASTRDAKVGSPAALATIALNIVLARAAFVVRTMSPPAPTNITAR